MYFLELMESLREQVLAHSQAVVFLEAGHFDPRHAVTPFSKNSLEDALQLTKLLIKEFNRNIKIVLGMLVDDLGLECNENSCSLAKDLPVSSEETKEVLPNDLEALLLASHFFKRDRLVVSSERTCKNRGINTLKKLIKSQSETALEFIKDGSATKVTFKDNEQNDILLGEFTESIWKAKCPTIMGQHYIDCFNKMRQRHSHLEHLIIIDWSEMLDYSKVTAGSQAAIKVFKNDDLQNLSLSIINIFFCDNSGEIYEIKEFKNSLVERLQGCK